MNRRTAQSRPEPLPGLATFGAVLLLVLLGAGRTTSIGATVPTAMTVPLAAATTTATTTVHQVTCTYPKGATKAAAVAKKLQTKIWAAVSSSTSRMGASVFDWNTKVWCSYAGARTFDSASIIKATTVATMLWQAQKAGRALTATEQSWARAAITRSDNAAQSAMWAHVGYGAGVKKFLKAAKMNQTKVSPGGSWGLTQVTAHDQVVLLRVLADPGLLSGSRRNYELKLMRSVISSQRWGVPDGAPGGTTVANKNGWLPRATKGWRINSIGLITGSGHRYAIAIVSDTNPSMSAGVDRIEKVARAIHSVLA